MGLAHGNDGIVKVGSNAVAEVQNWEYNEEDIAIVEKSSMGDTAAVPYPSGCKRGAGSIECLWDNGDTNGQDALTPGASVTLNLYPEGDTSGDIEYTGTVIVTSKGLKVDKTTLNMVSFAFQGVLTKGAVA